ncbi:hypothetical protein Tco_0848510 [Tanacetum coccineum]
MMSTPIDMMDIGTLCRETISFIYNLVRVSILSVALVGMKCADLDVASKAYCPIPRRCSRRCPILDCFNLGEVNVNSLAVNHVPEKLHNTDPEITFGELWIIIEILFERHDKLLTLVAFLTQRKVFSVPIVFSWGDNISPDDFLPSIMLLLVIIVAVSIVVTVILVVVVIGEGMIHNELSNSAKIDSSKGYSGGGVVDLIGDEDPTDEDRDNGMGDPIGGSVSLGGVDGIICSIS